MALIDRQYLVRPLWLAAEWRRGCDPRPCRIAKRVPSRLSGCWRAVGDLSNARNEQTGPPRQQGLSRTAWVGSPIERVNQVWCSEVNIHHDGAKGSLPGGRQDWVSRAVWSWRLSKHDLPPILCRGAEEALVQYGPPEIFTYRPGKQFTSDDFTGTLNGTGHDQPVDGRAELNGQHLVERLWRSLNTGGISQRLFATGDEAQGPASAQG